MKTKIEFISQLSRRIVKEECNSDKKVEFVKFSAIHYLTPCDEVMFEINILLKI